MQNRRRQFMRCIAVLGIVMCATAVAAAPASASDNGSWSVSPTGTNGVTPRDWFEYQLRPGQTLRDMVSVSNLTDHDMTFKIYAADAYNAPGDAAFALKLRTDEAADAGAWIHFGLDTLTVPARSRADFPFELSIPPDASPGDHTAGIIAEDASPPSATDQTGVAIQRRVGTRVYIRVNGPVHPELAVTKIGIRKRQALFPPFSGRGQLDAGYVITNTGNVRLAGQATLRLKGLFGRTLKTLAPVDIPELLPGGSFVVNEPLGSLPIIDRLRIEVAIKAPGLETTRSKAIWDIPWLEVLIVVILAVGFEARRRYRRWRDQRPERPEPPSAPEPDREPALV